MHTVLLAVVACLTGASEPANDVYYIKVGRALTGDGVVDNATIGVQGGRIQSVTTQAAPPGAILLDFSKSTASPGFIDLATQLSMRADILEPARALTPGADARDAIDFAHSQFRDAARSGVVIAGLSPSSGNLIGGRIAVVQCAGANDVADWIAEGPMRLSITGQALDPYRVPTSRAAAVGLLREHFRETPKLGGKWAVIEARSADEIRLALEVVRESGARPALLNPLELWRAPELLEDSGAGVIFTALGSGSDPQSLRLPKEITERGIPVAFSAGGDGEALRFMAALAVRNGLSEDLALAALTKVPAIMLCIDEQTGSLQTGRRADILITSAHPLDLGARIEAVFIQGRRVRLEDAPHKKETP